MSNKCRQNLCSRRQALLAMASSAAASSVGGCSGASGEPEPFGDVPAGLLGDIPVGTVRKLEDAPGFIARDELGLYAMTSTCTHEGCDLYANSAAEPPTLSCSCHGALFDRGGNVLGGPAESALAHFKVELGTDGTVLVRGGQRVAPSVRLAVA